MVRQNKEVNDRLEIQTPVHTLKIGTLQYEGGTARADIASTLELTSGTARETVEEVRADGYISVDIGGTTGFIPLYISRT